MRMMTDEEKRRLPCARMHGKYSAGLQRVRKVLADTDKPLSPHEIAAAASISVWTFNNHYRKVLLAAKEMYASGWYRHAYGWAQTFAAGTGATPQKPKAQPHKVATAEWKKRTGYVDPRYAHRRLAKPKGALAALLGLTRSTTQGASGAGKELTA